MKLNLVQCRSCDADDDACDVGAETVAVAGDDDDVVAPAQAHESPISRTSII